jgi:hypothetical protein
VLTTHGNVNINGQVTLADVGWNNTGTVNVAAGSTAALVLQDTGSFANQAGGTLRIDQGVLDANFGAAHANDGAIVLQNGGTLRSTGGDIYNNGTISGTGTLALAGASGGTLFNNGTVAPGTSSAPGTLFLQGNYVQGGAGALDVKLAGLGSGQFGLLDIDGSAQLAGTVRLQNLSGFAPANGASADFVVARGGSNSGAFDSVVTSPLATTSGVTTLAVSYPASGSAAARVAATLVAVTPPPGPAPSSDFCATHPIDALCQALSAPTGSSPAATMQQLADQEIATLLQTLGSTLLAGSAPKDSGKAKVSVSGASKAPAKKMYCN